MTRIYVPATLDLLADWYAAGELPSAADGYAAADDGEETEYAALMSAADDSTALLAGAGRRVVVVVDAPDKIAHHLETQVVPLKLVAAVHADLADRPAGADPDEDLGWFATQEIPELVAQRER
ncbi:hypothetical protein FB381_3603 [Nocardioides albertanoniae]|uniref:Uncharacterized protein n=1 Tax=Nocardioides albertanoniae TaxID=1175486 RepID=A0A543AAZ7_9ACTN|nr:hypothetical protein [Nocardioides albertanoniae]TQL69690.1 hypothetical protein FB381_3603 [Nocardioides albertanoniae]